MALETKMEKQPKDGEPTTPSSERIVVRVRADFLIVCDGTLPHLKNPTDVFCDGVFGAKQVDGSDITREVLPGGKLKLTRAKRPTPKPRSKR